MILFLPFWLTIGRMLLGVGGWGIFFYIRVAVPALLVILPIIAYMAIVSTPKGGIRGYNAVVLWVTYALIFLQGFFAVDGGDTEESVGSVASHLFGRGFIDASTSLTYVFYWASIVALMCSFVWLGMSLTPKPKK